MIRLTGATVYKYKCIENEQSFSVEPDVTVLVGMNESGKTSLLEALAKVNYFENDKDFTFISTHDYPRKQKKAMDRSGEVPEAVKLDYEVDDCLLEEIETDVLLPYPLKKFSYTKKYDNKGSYSSIPISVKQFVINKLAALKITGEKYTNIFSNVNNSSEFDSTISSLQTEGETAECLETLSKLKPYFENSWKWDNPIQEYITRTYISKSMPKFMYYDNYYMLPSRILIDKINKGEVSDSSEKTARALLELADIDTSKIIQSDSFEDFKAELEATQAIISDELFEYWSSNKNLRIMFDIDKVEGTDASNNRRIVNHILDIRVQNLRSGVSLPLANRSKGFNWFFSFLVWFKKIQENKSNTYILLLDEPGLNLHAMAQHDLLRFIKDLSKGYQIIYTTHSPFMIESDSLHRVRTVVEKENGTHVSDCLQEKDPNTLFPLQAALGYTLAQNLFVSPKNLVVEGIADLIYLNIISNILSELGRVSLRDDVTIVPVGGTDKVYTFVSLLRGNELGIVCLLDTFSNQAAKAKLDNLIAQNIIKDKKIIFYHNILNISYADVEDLFSHSDYLKLYNGAFQKNVQISELNEDKPIMEQLKLLNGKKDFNHYNPANYLAKHLENIILNEYTLNNFETLFKKINKMF